MHIAVYGTLKDGYSNHYLIKDAKYLGSAVTASAFFIMDRFGGSFPTVYEARKAVHRIKCELYDVTDDSQLESIDGLEGHPTWYERKPFTFLTDSGNVVQAHMYVQQNYEHEEAIYKKADWLPTVVEWRDLKADAIKYYNNTDEPPPEQLFA